mgnify:CR=1 FL=1
MNHKEANDNMKLPTSDVEQIALRVAGVQHALAQALSASVCKLFVVAKNEVVQADLETIRDQVIFDIGVQRGSLFNAVDVKVLHASTFNKAVRALLSRNYELEAELKRVRELTPDVDAAIRALDAVVRDPVDFNMLEAACEKVGEYL